MPPLAQSQSYWYQQEKCNSLLERKAAMSRKVRFRTAAIIVA